MMKARSLIGMGAAAALAVAVAGGCHQPRRDNNAVSADIRHELTRQQLPETITVVVADGVANLSGTVRNEDARAKAEDIAEDVNGVTRVVNNIRVTTAAGDAPAAVAPAMPPNGAANAPAMPGGQNVPPANPPR